MSKPFKILSIDFDYFQKVSANTISNYPDGIDLSPEISSMCWSGHYSDKRISKVSINKDEIENLKSLLSRQENLSKVMIACSHKSIYDFTKDEVKGTPTLLWNIDMHHDMFNDNKEVDCGNWVSHLGKLTDKFTLKWCCNPISEECYGMEKDRFYMLSHSVSEIKDTDFDYVFLCRSDSWLPPHLDKEFALLSDFMIKNLHCPILYDKRLNFDRYDACMTAKKQIDDAMKELNQHRTDLDENEIGR